MTGKSSPGTFNFSMDENGHINFSQGDPSPTSKLAVGGGIPLIIDGLKYGAQNIYSSDAPPGLPLVGDPGDANRKYLLQRSNAGFPLQDNDQVGKSILAYDSNTGTIMLVVQQNGTNGMNLTQIRDYLAGLGFNNAISFDGSSSATLIKDNSTLVQPSNIKNNTIPSGIIFTTNQ